MSPISEYGKYDALGLARLVKQGQVTAGELVAECISRIEAGNPGLNAVVHKMYGAAEKTAAGDLSGAFAGVPFLLKDLLADYAGEPTSQGCKALVGRAAAQDSEMVRRFKAAGLIVAGKTNTPEFGLLGITEPELFGPCRNPWDTQRTPGGSSGGSAAAVAAGFLPMASGGDGGGSIRIPAAYCGLFGLKPSRGRNPTGPEHGRIWQGAVVEHVITRGVADSAAMLDATAGPESGAPYSIAPPARPYLAEAAEDPKPKKIALCTESPLGTPVHPECARAAERAAELLAQLGHQVELDQPAVDGPGLASSYLMMYFGETAADIRALGPVLGRKAKPGDVEPLTWMMGLLGKSYSAGDFVEAMRRWDRAARVMGEFFTRYDLYLTPTTAMPPAKIGELAPRGMEALLMKTVNLLNLGGLLKAAGLVDKLAVESLARTPFTQLANLTGLPAMSLPLYWTPEGMPLGAHVTAPLGDEATLFQVAGQLERAQPWFDKRPTYQPDAAA